MDSSLEARDDGAIKGIGVPEIPTPLTHTFTTHFDLRKGHASHVSTAMGMSRERRASMDDVDETRPKFDHSEKTGHHEIQDEADDKLFIMHRGNTFQDDIWARPWFINACTAGLVLVAGMFIFYKWKSQ